MVFDAKFLNRPSNSSGKSVQAKHVGLIKLSLRSMRKVEKSDLILFEVKHRIQEKCFQPTFKTDSERLYNEGPSPHRPLQVYTMVDSSPVERE